MTRSELDTPQRYPRAGSQSHPSPAAEPELSEKIDPEDWHRIMERFFTILTDAVHRFAGTVNQYTGDGIMALFGAPIAHEDHAQRACYAALHLRKVFAVIQTSSDSGAVSTE